MHLFWSLYTPEKFGLHLKSKNSASLIKSYEDKGLLPGSVTIGAGFKKGPKRAGYYYPVVLEMIRDIKNLDLMLPKHQDFGVILSEHRPEVKFTKQKWARPILSYL